MVRRSVTVVALGLIAIAIGACGAPQNTLVPQPLGTTTLQPEQPSPISPANPSPIPSEQDHFPYSVDSQVWLSPDQLWTAIGVKAWPPTPTDGHGVYFQLKVAKADNSVKWLVEETWEPYRSGMEGWEQPHWSIDGRYLYFARWWAPNGCAVFENTSDWYRVDLRTGKTTPIKLSISALAFSPDETAIAYISWSEPELKLGVYDLNAGTERLMKLDIGAARVGNIVWSPDGKALAFVALNNACEPGSEARSIEIVDLGSLSQTTLIRDDHQIASIVGWPKMGQLLIRNLSQADSLLDVNTGQFLPGPAKSTP